MAGNRGVRIHRFGGPEVPELEDLPMPEPHDDEVVVRVHAASINPVDCKLRSGGYPTVKESDLPIVLGRDLPGTVELCGTTAHTLKKGNPIYAMVGPDRGTYAWFVLAARWCWRLTATLDSRPSLRRDLFAGGALSAIVAA